MVQNQTQEHKKWLAIHQRTLQKQCLHIWWPTLRGSKQFIFTTALSSCARAQKMGIHTVTHYTTGISNLHMSNLESSKTLSQHFLLFYARCIHSVHIFLLHESNTDKTQTPKQFTDNYNYIWSPPYKSIE